jgi:uncharacterized membrane protein YidH (DUF202 family)
MSLATALSVSRVRGLTTGGEALNELTRPVDLCLRPNAPPPQAWHALSYQAFGRACSRLVDVHRRTLATVVLLLGIALALLGAMLFLNFLSLRDVVAATHVDPAIAVVFDTRDEMSHRRAQGLELIAGVAGIAIVLGVSVWLRAARRESRG